FQAEDGIRDRNVTGVQTCALPISTYSGGGVGELLASYDGAVPVNLGYLVPASTVRNEVLGRAERPATLAETERMADLVATGMAEIGRASCRERVAGWWVGESV